LNVEMLTLELFVIFLNCRDDCEHEHNNKHVSGLPAAELVGTGTVFGQA
jgi:hypothetical protein